MSNVASSDKVRQAVAWHLQCLGARETCSMHETILIRNGLFCGRKFRCEEYEVVWFDEEDEIKFFGPCGQMLRVSSVATCLADFDRQRSLEPQHDLDDDRRAA